MSGPTLRPITRADVDAVVTLLQGSHMASMPVARIRQIVLHDWPVDRPDYGLLLEAEGRVVGCILAVYSERTIRGRRERFCNVGTWFVEPAFRSHSLRLSWKLSELQGYTLTAFTPNPTSEALFRRSKYKLLTEGLHLYAPGQGARGTRLLGVRVTGDVDAIERELDERDRRILRDHRPFACRHFLLTARGESGYAYVVTKRWKVWRDGRIPVTELLHVSDPSLAIRCFERLKLGILLRDRSVFLGVDRRLLGEEAPVGRPLARRPRFFRSDTLGPSDVDDLYSEVVLL